MGRPRIKFHSLCTGDSTPRLGSKKFSSGSTKSASRTEFSSNEGQDSGSDKGSENGNKVMVVVDSSFEAKGALDWALSHTIQCQDTVVLAHVARPTREGQKKNRLKYICGPINYFKSLH